MPGTIVILNGPNLNILGIRQPEIYGTQTLENISTLCEQCASSLYLKTDFKQSNHEGQLIDWIQQAGEENAAGLILNPAGFGHSSVAILDALLALKIPVVEVHLSNIYKREPFRNHTYTARGAQGVIAGFGSYGYLLGIYAIGDIIKNAPKPA